MMNLTEAEKRMLKIKIGEERLRRFYEGIMIDSIPDSIECPCCGKKTLQKTGDKKSARCVESQMFQCTHCKYIKLFEVEIHEYG